MREKLAVLSSPLGFLSIETAETASPGMVTPSGGAASSTPWLPSSRSEPRDACCFDRRPVGRHGDSSSAEGTSLSWAVVVSARGSTPYPKPSDRLGHASVSNCDLAESPDGLMGRCLGR